jgi:hypothetical protein
MHGITGMLGAFTALLAELQLMSVCNGRIEPDPSRFMQQCIRIRAEV